MARRKDGMKAQRLIVIVLIIGVFVFGAFALRPQGKYHKPSCFWVKLITEKDIQDFTSGTLYVGLFNRGQYREYMAYQRLGIEKDGLKRCLWCQPTKP